MTIVLTAVQNSPLVIDSSNNGSKINEYLICFTPLSMAFDSPIQTWIIVEHLAGDFGKLTIIAKQGKKIENLNN